MKGCFLGCRECSRKKEKERENNFEKNMDECILNEDVDHVQKVGVSVECFRCLETKNREKTVIRTTKQKK